jgi:Mor family transcriptional regulator
VCTKCSGYISPKNRSGVCNECIRKEQRKDRPSYNQLKKDLEESNYVKVGQKYKVSDNAIRKWMKRYEEMENAG